MKKKLNTITRVMKSYERIINWYNNKYNFDIKSASPKEQKEYNSALNVWDQLRCKRDGIKSAVFAQL